MDAFEPSTLEIIRRRDARTQGLPFYFTGLPCIGGHIAPRRVSSKTCTVCEIRSPAANLRHVQQWYAGLTDEERKAYNNRKSRNWRKDRVPIKVDGICAAADIERLMQRQQGLCVGCSRDIREKFEVDHIVSPSRGGSHWPHNRQLLCRSCNAQKRDRTNDEWLPSHKLHADRPIADLA